MAWRCGARRLHREPTNDGSEAERCGHALALSRFSHSWLAARGLRQSVIWMLWNDLQYPCRAVRYAARHEIEWPYCDVGSGVCQASLLRSVSPDDMLSGLGRPRLRCFPPGGLRACRTTDSCSAGKPGTSTVSGPRDPIQPRSSRPVRPRSSPSWLGSWFLIDGGLYIVVKFTVGARWERNLGMVI